MKTVLLTDDNPTNRELIREVLEAAGFKVVEACDGHEALELARSCGPHVMLLDVQMPKLDGIRVIAEIRKDPALSSLPVIAITAFAMQGDRERILAAGFDAYVTKPIDFPALVAEVRTRMTGRS